MTVSTAGLTADAGAEGAVQVQFVTKRGTNAFRGQVFDQIQNEKLNANRARQQGARHSEDEAAPARVGRQPRRPDHPQQAVLLRQLRAGLLAERERRMNRNVLTAEAQQGIFRYIAADGAVRTVNLLDIARANGLPATIDPVRRAAVPDRSTPRSAQGNVAAARTCCQNTFRFVNPQIAERQRLPDGARRLSGDAERSRFAAC